MKTKIKSEIKKNHCKLVYILSSFGGLYFLQFVLFGTGLITNSNIELICFVLMYLLFISVIYSVNDLYTSVLEYIDIDKEEDKHNDEK